MRKYQKAAVVMAMLGSVASYGAGVSHAGDKPSFELDNKQTTTCAQEQLGPVADRHRRRERRRRRALGLGNAENTEVNSVACASSLGLGG
ncbi:hypothetical protein GCM10023238_00940 [Streptomyces heliomycini]